MAYASDRLPIQTLLSAHALIILRCAVANVGISGSDFRDMMLAAVEARFGGQTHR